MGRELETETERQAREGRSRGSLRTKPWRARGAGKPGLSLDSPQGSRGGKVRKSVGRAEPHPPKPSSRLGVALAGALMPVLSTAASPQVLASAGLLLSVTGYGFANQSAPGLRERRPLPLQTMQRELCCGGLPHPQIVGDLCCKCPSQGRKGQRSGQTQDQAQPAQEAEEPWVGGSQTPEPLAHTSSQVAVLRPLDVAPSVRHSQW